ncbi:hypothetical protein Taro_008707 [Colocasia esculenta]|uniref:Uncharacterized protein n=1 Tax=Colocasia esculenta TaxID=4460 RepID=A0A843U476_COLES|nr:hypothetical protein [Colocasia esculenta]
MVLLRTAGVLKEVRRGAVARLGCGGCVVLCCESLASLYRGGCKQESTAGKLEEWTVSHPLSCLLAVYSSMGLVSLASWAVFSGFRFCGFCNPFLGTVRGGTGVCSSLTLWRVRVEVRDVGACVVRLGSHVVALVFRELLCLGGCVPRVCFRIVLDFAGFVGVVFGLTQSSSAFPVVGVPTTLAGESDGYHTHEDGTEEDAQE